MQFVRDELKVELKQWTDNPKSQERVINHCNPNTVTTSNASLMGWAGKCSEQEIDGRWSVNEASHHINMLKMMEGKPVSVSVLPIKAESTCSSFIRRFLQSFLYSESQNSTRQIEYNNVVHDLLICCMERRVQLTASHIPGIQNTVAHGSRNFSDNIERQLNRDFVQTCKHTGLS